jgi:hypothetical protein
MTRIPELIGAVRAKFPGDRFFGDFEESCKASPAKRAPYQAYEDALRLLDPRSWQVLKDKALAHFRDERRGQLKQGFFCQLNEAFAYRFLIRRDCTDVEVLPERGSRTPDIRYVEAGVTKHCEVKTLALSDEEIRRRDGGQVFKNAYIRLEDGFLRKLASTVATARAQIAAQGTDGFVYLVALFDDLALDYYPEYRRDIQSFCRRHDIAKVYIKVGLRGTRRLRITGRCTRRRLAGS